METETETEAGARQPNYRRRRIVVGTLAVVFILAIAPGISFVGALTAPGNTSTTERSVEWLRDHGGGGVVNTVEHWWFTNHPPPEGGQPTRSATFDAPVPSNAGTPDAAASTDAAAPTDASANTSGGLPRPVDVVSPASTPVGGEGVWQPIGQAVGGSPAMYATQVRPDDVHTTVLDGLLWIDPTKVTFALHPGRQEPGGSWPTSAQVPSDSRLSLLAAFNGGFRMRDAKGGFYIDGQAAKPLVDGAASFVISNDGTATVGTWGRDVSMSDRVVSVRQNLELIVDGGRPVDGLDNNADGRWGETLGNKVLVWRSAVCVNPAGAIIYGYGDAMGAQSLAELMARAGCDRAMELDINPSWTTANIYAPTRAGDPASVTGTPLLPDQKKKGSRYLSDDSRDFFTVSTKQSPPA